MSLIDYHMNDCVLPLPRGFTDRTVHILEWTVAPGEKLAMVVQRERVGEGATLEECVEAETRDYATKFLGFRLDRDETENDHGIGGVRRKVFRFKKDQDVFHNHQVFILDGTQLILISASARAHHRDDVDQVVDDAIAGMRLRDD